MVKYKEIAKKIKQKIINKEYNVNFPLPNQETLAKEFNTSRITIQKALHTLVIEGVIFTQQGSGTFIRKNTLEGPAFDLSFDEYIGLTKRVANQAEIENKIILFDVRFPNDEECEKLLIKKTDPIYDIIRLRLLNNEPYLMEYIKMPIHVVPNISESILLSSVYTYIKDELNLKIGGANRKIKADLPTTLEIEYLKCNSNIPMLEVEQVTYLSNGTPFEYLHSRHTYDKRSIIIHSLYSDN